MCAFSVLFAAGAADPKAPGSGLIENVPMVQEIIEGQELPGHVTAPDGATILLRRYASPGAEALRLRFTDFHLPEEATMFVYSLTPSGQARKVKAYTGTGPLHTGEFLTHAVPGDQLIVEVVWGEDVPANDPFEVAEILTGAEEVEDSVDLPAQDAEVRTGLYRGMQLTYEVRDGIAMFENDIVLGPVEEVERGDSEPSSKESARFGMGITGLRFRWPGGRIPYVINSALPGKERVTAAISHWNSKLSGVIRLVPRTNEMTYVEFVRSGGCSSAIGMLYGRQQISISDTCSTGNVIHEIGHTVGLWHEQSREDRNSYVRINWSNISSTATKNFSQANATADDLGAYDFGSIMHYGPFIFTSNGKPTIETIPAGIPIGQRTGLSAGDVAAVRRMYGAPITTTATNTTTPTTPTATTTPTPTTTAPSASITIAASPTGQQIKVDGVQYAAPRTFNWTVGSTHTVEALDTPTSTFVKWSNGASRVHTLTASTSLTNLSATYSTSHRVTTSRSPSYGGNVFISPDTSTDLYSSGSVVSLTAQPAAGYCFSSWSGLLSGTPPVTTLSVNKGYAITANFLAGSITLSKNNLSAPASGGAYSLGVQTTSGCMWVASEASSWLTITSATRGTGPGVLTFNIAPNNTSSVRWGVITVGNQRLTIYQLGVQ